MNAKKTKIIKVASKVAASNSSVYYFENNLRKVQPYTNEFLAYCKLRWRGIALYDVYCKEFLANTPQYYAQAIDDGRITVNGKKVEKDYKLKENDRLVHTVLRSEVPVVD